MQVKTTTISAAISSLQARLGETQEGMARKLGCTLGAYSKWVRGERIPSGDWMLELLQLCPDEETRAQFGLAPALPPTRTGLGKLPTPRNDKEEEILRLYSDAAAGLNLVWEAAMAGHAGAKTALADLADRLATRGGDWRQMKYFRK
jgi:transcriptional regulator with XRE-family HTH domain